MSHFRISEFPTNVTFQSFRVINHLIYQWQNNLCTRLCRLCFCIFCSCSSLTNVYKLLLTDRQSNICESLRTFSAWKCYNFHTNIGNQDEIWEEKRHVLLCWLVKSCDWCERIMSEMTQTPWHSGIQGTVIKMFSQDEIFFQLCPNLCASVVLLSTRCRYQW